MSRDSIEKNQVWIYIICVIVAMASGLALPHVFERLGILVTPLIAILMYAMFLQIPFLALKEPFSDKRFLFALMTANFIFIPVIVGLLTLTIADNTAIFIGALLVLLTPCIDYVVVFTHIGKGNSRQVLSATPLLLILQLMLLPLYLKIIAAGQVTITISVEPFIEAFVFLILIPLCLAVITLYLSRKSKAVSAWNAMWGWLPVPAMAAVLIAVIGSQINTVVREITWLLPVVPVYLCFAVLAPLAGAFAARLFRLPTASARAVAFSASTRNSLVVLPLALALPENIRVLAAAAVITQTLVELVSEIIYTRAIPRFIRQQEPAA